MKKFKLFMLLGVCALSLSGCISKDDFSDDYTYTTIYPIEYATKIIYGDYSNISSIYPDGVIPSEYKLTDKMLNTYSKGEKFVYNGLTDERLIARDLLNLNGNIGIIDGMKGMDYTSEVEELWLDPANFLMVCRNIKGSLIDYEDNIYTKDAIEENYQALKEDISILDVDIYNLSKNGTYKTLLVTNDSFNYLTKYGLNVLSLDPDNEALDKSTSEARKLIANGDIKNVYSIKGESVQDATNTFINDYKLNKIEIDPFSTITDAQRVNGETYISLMNSIIEEFKKELFK